MPADTALDPPPAETAAPPTAKRGAPQERDWPAEVASIPVKTSRIRRQQRLRWALFALLLLALIGGVYRYITGGQVMSTDDAYVNAEMVGISTDVAGIVQQIDVTENQHVDAGQVLYRLDPRQFQIALDNAMANQAQTALTISSMKQDYGRMLSDVAAQQAQVALNQTTNDRNASLVGTGAVSRATYDQARYTLQAANGKLESLRQQASVQLAKLDGNPDLPVTQHPQFLQAQVDEAQRQLDDTVGKAPFAGIVTNVPSIAPGKYLGASTTAFYLVASDHAWVDATPKETELTYERPGQPVTVTVDAYPNAVGTASSRASVRRQRSSFRLYRRRTLVAAG